MDISNSILDRYENKKLQEKAPRHEKAASVNEIIKVLGETKIYNYAYWLRKVGNATYSQILDILKETEKLETKYSKGGFITNQLKKYAIPATKPGGLRNNGRGDNSTKKDSKPRGRPAGTGGVSKVDDSKGRVVAKSIKRRSTN